MQQRRLAAIRATARGEAFRKRLADLVVELCALDTTPRADIAESARAEAGVFAIIEREVRAAALPGANLRSAPIDPRIARHSAFTPLYYAPASAESTGPDITNCYADRGNLVLSIDGDQRAGRGVNQAINVHIDVVAPYFAPHLADGVIRGRGACDNKGNVAALLGALQLLGDGWARQPLPRHLTCMFVIDEETGGNGSLSLAIDRALKARYDSLLVLECTGGRLHPGNRGCVWYRIDGDLPGANLFEAASFIVAELEAEGGAIRAESEHPLYPHRPVQTCHGIIGNSGAHPSRINGDVSFRIVFSGGGDSMRVAQLIRDVIDDGLARYIGGYGDKTKPDPSGQAAPKVEHHYVLEPCADGWVVRVFGATGHMGAIRENDGAITKMASMVRALVRSRAALASAVGGDVRVVQQDWPDESRLLMEGGQGFIPTHAVAEIKERMRAAMLRGARRYFGICGVDLDPAGGLRMGFDKLHNDAYACDAESSDMHNAHAAARAAGMETHQPVVGWDVSCDARLFAREYPELPVITAGAGALEYAHADDERITVDEVAQAAEFLAYFILRQTGAVESRLDA
jgi:acetylornithine deacetylase/succinyl-diaminopimelate desuccinylase-like protein